MTLLNIALLTLLIVFAICSIEIKDLLSSVIIFCGYSFLMCILWALMQAPDVALTEAAVGAGITTVLFLATIFKTTNKTND